MKTIIAWITIFIMGAAVFLFVKGEWKMGLIALAIDFIFSWICGYIIMRKENQL
jgi:hypothetical protein